MSKFTPGPWSAKVDETATIRDAQDNQIGIMTHLKTKFGGRRDSDEVAANTRLAADAPALLEALKSLLNSIPSLTCESFHHARKDRHSHDDECPPFERYLAEAIKARALIAKHRGGK